MTLRSDYSSMTPAAVAATNSDEAIKLLDELQARKLAIEPDQAKFAELCDHWDNLYYPQSFTRGGASHWASHPSARTAGKAHVSVNAYPVYVDVPAALQSEEPEQNMVALGNDEQMRQIAAMAERLYFGWKAEQDVEMKTHMACVVKGLYGLTASKVYWDDDENKVCFEVVDQPKNLYLGWRSSDYLKLEWALYCYQITPQTALEDFGVRIEERTDGDGRAYPYVVHPAMGPFTDTWRANMVSADLRVEVYDYWYRKPKKGANVRMGKKTAFETWNAVFVGNIMVANIRHPEYGGKMPYVPLYNTYIPGMNAGRPEMYDIEQLIREKDERVSGNAQMIDRAIQGQQWQLTGQDAPAEVPAGLKPTPNNVVAPGPGNRLEAIQPWMPEFQLETFLTRLDRELDDVSGLNELLRGMAPMQALNSSKAIATMTANYVTRIMMKRGLLYGWRRSNWALAAEVWAFKVPELRPILEAARLNLEPPDLTPRDAAETITMAGNAKELKLWSAVRAMDKTGVDDPETEMDIIRAEQTDATLNPGPVLSMVSLMAALQQLQMSIQQFQAMAQQQGGPTAGAPGQNPAQAANTQRQLAPQTAATPAQNGPGEQPVTPAEQLPANAAPGGAGAGPSQVLGQFQIGNEGEAKSRIIGQSTIQKSG